MILSLFCNIVLSVLYIFIVIYFHSTAISFKPGTHDETFVCNTELQTKLSWCVRPRKMFQEIFYGS